MEAGTKILPSLEALQQEAKAFVHALSPRADAATLITLSGELGAGKTSFTQGAARALGVSEAVTSPTFVLEKIYALPSEVSADAGAIQAQFARLVHIDAYRLEGGAALAPLNFAELLTDPQNLILLEWPERVADALPQPACAISLSVLPDNTRSISYAYA